MGDTFAYNDQAQQSADLRHVFVLDGDIEVGVWTHLLAEQGVYAPAAVNEDLDVMLVEEVEERENFVRGRCGHG